MVQLSHLLALLQPWPGSALCCSAPYLALYTAPAGRAAGAERTATIIGYYDDDRSIEGGGREGRAGEGRGGFNGVQHPIRFGEFKD